MTDTELVNRTALNAANAIAWPGDDDAEVSIADEDDLKKILEAAAPHVSAQGQRAALTDLQNRTVRAINSVSALTLDHEVGSPDRARLSGKADGMRVVLSYVEEALRILADAEL